MTENLNYALQITVIGMSLVFLAILMLWGLMSLLMRLMAEQESAEDVPLPAAAVNDVDASEALLRQQAAAAAVAVALALEEEAPHGIFTPTQPTLVSAWQAVMRANLLNQKGPRR